MGVAIGVFICILPIYGLHTVAVIIMAILVRRANKLAMFLGTSFSIPPTLPFITWTAYDIGRFILSEKHYPPLSWEYFKSLRLEDIGKFYYPLFVGSVILGIICAIVFYIITFIIMKVVAAKKRSAHV